MAAETGRIVVGVDPSAHAAAAVSWAAREAADRGMPLHLINALGLPPGDRGMPLPGSYAEAGRTASGLLLRHLASVVADQYPQLAVTSEVSETGAAESLVALGGEDDLLVTGTRGHGGFAGLLLGSVSLKTAVHAHCPAVVVRGHEKTAPSLELVLGVEGGESEAPIRFAFESCERLGARLLVVRAWLSAPSYAGYYLTSAPATDAEQFDDVEKLVGPVRAAHPLVEVETRVIRGNAVPALIDAARGSRLLIVGAHRRRAPLSVGAGYVVQGLLSHAETPIAVVPIA